MKIWTVTIGEPVPVSQGHPSRLHRTGQFVSWASKHAEIVWWTSAFDHFEKKFIADDDIAIRLNQNLSIRCFRGCGYRRNISLARFRDQNILSQKIFNAMSAESQTPDLILCSVPPVELAQISVEYGKLHDLPVILDLRDMWPDIFVDHAPTGLKSLARVLLSPLFDQAKKVFSGADAQIGITEEFVEWGLSKAGKNKGKWDVSFPFAYNSMPPESARIAAANESWDKLGIRNDGKSFRVCFFGTLSRQFDIPTVIAASGILRKQGVSAQFVVCGDGDRLNDFRKSAAGNTDILFPGWVDAASIYSLMRRSSVGIAPLPDRYDFLATINNKSVEYLSAGLPIVSCPAVGTLASFLKKHDCGLSFKYGDADSLAKLIAGLIKEPGKLQRMSVNAAEAFDNNFVADKVNGKMFAHLERISSEYRMARAGK